MLGTRVAEAMPQSALRLKFSECGILCEDSRRSGKAPFGWENGTQWDGLMSLYNIGAVVRVLPCLIRVVLVSTPAIIELSEVLGEGVIQDSFARSFVFENPR